MGGEEQGVIPRGEGVLSLIKQKWIVGSKTNVRSIIWVFRKAILNQLELQDCKTLAQKIEGSYECRNKASFGEMLFREELHVMT